MIAEVPLFLHSKVTQDTIKAMLLLIIFTTQSFHL